MKSGERVGKSVSMPVGVMRVLERCVMAMRGEQSILSRPIYRWSAYSDTMKRWMEVQIELQVKA